jgi:mevalonate kinase
VGDVRRRWSTDPDRFEGIFDGCGRIVGLARRAIERGAVPELGQLMIQNQALLRDMTVSSAELDHLVEAAISAGALGAKLSGAGRGGNMIALVNRAQEEAVGQALLAAGATAVMRSILS